MALQHRFPEQFPRASVVSSVTVLYSGPEARLTHSRMPCSSLSTSSPPSPSPSAADALALAAASGPASTLVLPPRSQQAPRAGFAFALTAVAALTALDQVTKLLARRLLPLGQITPLVPHFFDLSYVPNRGVAFGTLATLPARVRTPLLLVVPLLVTVFLSGMLYRSWGRASRLARASWVLVLAGAISNLIDRAAFGEVTDFVLFRYYDHVFFINNVADDYISIGATLLALGSLWHAAPLRGVKTRSQE